MPRRTSHTEAYARSTTSKWKGRERARRIDRDEPERSRELRRARTLGSGDCWCGEPFGHDWPGRADGAPHPR